MHVILISDRKRFSEDEFLEKLDLALKGGIRTFQLREKDLSKKDLLALAIKVREITKAHGADLFINNRADIAESSGAEGVHLPEDGLPVKEVHKQFPRLQIGVSTHSLDGAKRAQLEGADFITFSPIFETPSKMQYGPPQGLEKLEEVTDEIIIPVLALGGIGKENVPSVLEHGAFGIALISGIWNSSDIQNEAFEYMKFFGGDNPDDR